MFNNAKDSMLNNEYDRNKFSLANESIWEKLSLIKGASFSDYRKLLKKAEAGLILTRLPVEIFLKTTFNCNHRCPRCPHGTGVAPTGKAYDMKFETLKKVLDESSEKDVKSVVFTGGEPTLHRDFVKFLEFAGTKNFPDLSIVTNGSLLTDRVINAIIETGVTRLNVSFDSISSQVYKKVRGVDDYNKVLRNIDRLLEVREQRQSLLPLLSISFVLAEDNAHELDDFCLFWQKKADGGIKIYPYKNLYSILKENPKIYGKGKVSPISLNESQLPVKLSHNIAIMENYKIKCTIPWYRCHIGINGDIQACTTLGFCDHPEMTMGNIHNSSFEDAWKSQSWQTLRELTLSNKYNQHPVCSLCQLSI